MCEGKGGRLGRELYNLREDGVGVSFKASKKDAVLLTFLISLF